MALYELSQDDIDAIERACRFLRASIMTENAIALRRLEKLQPIKPVVAVYLKGGFVQGIRSNIPIDSLIADLDHVEKTCSKARDEMGDIIDCKCGDDVSPEDREDHVREIDKYMKYRTLAFGTY
jgi:hypothetical protein